jgi:hypothetical protein
MHLTGGTQTQAPFFFCICSFTVMLGTIEAAARDSDYSPGQGVQESQANHLAFDKPIELDW